MRESCISFLPGSGVVILRENYLAICGQNQCAAMILAQMQYWHEVKLEHRNQANAHNDAAARAGKEPAQETDLYIYKTQADMKEELCGLFGEKAIAEGYAFLLGKGFLVDRQNPRYSWDRTKQYMFNVSAVQDAINSLPSAQNCADAIRNNAESKPQICALEGAELRTRSRKYAEAIPETTTETTLETTPEKKNARPSAKELADYFRLLGSSGKEAEKFWDYYQSNGWKVGRNAMKDWRATVRTWIRRAAESKPQGATLAGETLQDRAQVNARKIADMRSAGQIPPTRR